MDKVKEGDRIVLVHTSDPHTRLKPGTKGTVSFIDSMGTVHAKWDDGSNLGLLPGEDAFDIIKDSDGDQDS